MSIFSDYKCGAVSYEELVSYCNHEEATDRAYEDAKRERIERAIHGYDEEEEEGDESDDEE